MHRTLQACMLSGTQVSEGSEGWGGLLIKINEALTRCQKSPSPRSSFPHRDPIWRWRSNSRRRSSSSTEGQEAAAAGGARVQRLRGLTMVDASPGTVPPQPGTPATPAGGWRQQPPPWRPQPLPPPQRPAKGSEEAREGGWKGKRAEGLRRLTGELLLPPPGWSAAGSGQEGAGGRRTREQRRRFPQGCGEEEAEIRSVGAGGRVPSPGSRRRRRRGPAGAHPTISHLAAGCPLSAERRPGRSSATSRTRARGLAAADSSRHAPAGTPPGGGGGGGGERVRPGQASRSPPPGSEKSRRTQETGSREAAGELGERTQVPHQPVPTSSSAGKLLTPARGEP